MPAKPLTPEQKQDAARLKEHFLAWRDALRKKGEPMSQEIAADRLGFGQSAFSQYLNGIIPLNGPVVSKCAELMGIKPESISPSIVAKETERSQTWSALKPRNMRPVWVVGATQGGMPLRIWDDAGYPVGSTEEFADVSTTDEHAFACRVVGDSMVPRYQPGEYALVEPSTVPDLEDDVLVRLASGETMLKRLLSRRGGVRLGSYNTNEVLTFREEEITWMYYVAHPIPARRIGQRVDLQAPETMEPPSTDLEQRPSARRLGGHGNEAAAATKEPRRRKSQ